MEKTGQLFQDNLWLLGLTVLVGSVAVSQSFLFSPAFSAQLVSKILLLDSRLHAHPPLNPVSNSRLAFKTANAILILFVSVLVSGQSS